MTNGDVVKLCQLDLGDDLVIAAIRRAPRVDFRLDTDGLASLREGRDVTPELAEAGLDAAVVSLNAPDGATYARLCPSRHGEAAWDAARLFIRAALRRISEVQASFVAVPGLDEQACRREAEALGAAFRWRPYDRVGRLRELGGSA